LHDLRAALLTVFHSGESSLNAVGQNFARDALCVLLSTIRGRTTEANGR